MMNGRLEFVILNSYVSLCCLSHMSLSVVQVTLNFGLKLFLCRFVCIIPVLCLYGFMKTLSIKTDLIVQCVDFKVHSTSKCGGWLF